MRNRQDENKRIMAMISDGRSFGEILRLVLLVGFAVLVGCSAATPVDHATDAGDADTDVLPVEPVEAVDILFIFDPGCAGAALRHELDLHAGVLVHELLEPEIDAETGEAPPPVKSLHAGFTTMSADMAGFQTAQCIEIDDGQLLFETSDTCIAWNARDCASPPCPWLMHSEATPDLGEPGNPPIWEDIGCLVQSSWTCACGWTQPLEAALRALTTRAAPGAANEGFLQDESVLALIFLTDGDDCSVADPALFDMEIEELGGFAERWILHPEMLHPVEEYVAAFSSLRQGMEDRIVVGVFGALPPDEEWQAGDPVEDLQEWVRVDPDDPMWVDEVCVWAGGGGAWPPPRLVEFAYAFGDGSYVISSICGSDWDSTSAMQEIARAILRRMSGS